MYSQTRGGTRGGAAEFKWSDVSADKDRENYLGHSINAPTGRWQKNKDVHWYNRDLPQSELERLEEIRKVKEAEEDALAAALGFQPVDRSAQASTSDQTSEKKHKSPEERASEKEEKRRLKEEKRRRKEEKRHRREHRRHHGSRSYSPVDPEDTGGRASYRRRPASLGSRSRSPHRDGSKRDIRAYDRLRTRSRSPPRIRSNSRDYHRLDPKERYDYDRPRGDRDYRSRR